MVLPSSVLHDRSHPIASLHFPLLCALSQHPCHSGFSCFLHAEDPTPDPASPLDTVTSLFTYRALRALAPPEISLPSERRLPRVASPAGLRTTLMLICASPLVFIHL